MRASIAVSMPRIGCWCRCSVADSGAHDASIVDASAEAHAEASVDARVDQQAEASVDASVEASSDARADAVADATTTDVVTDSGIPTYYLSNLDPVGDVINGWESGRKKTRATAGMQAGEAWR